tara:strand:+ start:3462 stop:4346 length:885 start_codon:yes stop_codon:yes gene_type:complete
MKVLITGANGQLGKEMIDLSPKFNLSVEAFNKNNLDITNKNKLQDTLDIIEPKILVNTAAFTSVDKAETFKESAYAVNHQGPKNLAELCRERSIFLIHISTDYVFNGLKGSEYEEHDQVSPINTYGDSKLKGEEEIRSIISEHIIIRTSWVFGAYGHNFIQTILNLIKNEKDLKIVNDQFGCPTSTRSLADCIYQICTKYSKNEDFEYGTYHFTNQPSTSWHNFAKEIMDLAYKYKIINEIKNIESISHKEYSSLASRPLNSSMSSRKICEMFNLAGSQWKEELELAITKLSIK